MSKKIGHCCRFDFSCFCYFCSSLCLLSEWVLFCFLSRHRAATVSRKEFSDAKVALCCCLPWWAQGLDQGWTAHSRLVHFSIFSARNTSRDFSAETNKQKTKKTQIIVLLRHPIFFKRKKILPGVSFINRRSRRAMLGPPAGRDAPAARGR